MNFSPPQFGFLVLAPNDWYGLWMNRQHLFSRIGQNQGMPVLFSNGLWSSWFYRAAFARNPPLGRFQFSDGVCVDHSPSLLLRPRRFPRADRVALQLGTLRLVRQFKRLCPQSAQRVLYACHPQFADYINLLPHDLLVYHAYDDFLAEDPREELRKAEDELLQRADLVICASPRVRDQFQTRSGRNDIELLINGVDFNRFAADGLHQPADLSQVPGPRIGYFGSINPKLDFQLIDRLTDNLGGMSFVFIGRVNNLAGRDHQLWSRIKTKNNVYYLGQKPGEQIPAYAQNLDVSALFYSTDSRNFGAACSPLKLFESLAAGTPVISSDIEAVRLVRHAVTIADGAQNWEDAIRTTVSLRSEEEKNNQQRQMRQLAQRHSWDRKAEILLDLIQDRLSTSSSKADAPTRR